ncbi:hypothetical protein RAH42_04730 [Pyramidobacter sp. YE332]|uniref:hypothetical protein n=1 Tax=unclassified Pyramidobacter TaxID=2632171 RepID=UPI00098F8705|nr:MULTISPECIES: hypothetical protein [unclassified Pyramidobacter]OON88881.1 hypothetical protein B0D78_06645 [Pyramidobacter sp. C12-8]WOL40946.1 hypothetical protein RAH42_04730 [Pyramidobacter sp. YE332]
MFPSAKRLTAVLIFCLSAALPAAAQEPSEAQRPNDLAFCKGCIAQELSARAALVKGDAFRDPDRDADLRQYVSLMYSPTTLSIALNFTGTPAEIQRCREIAAAFQRYNDTSLCRTTLGRMLNILAGNRAVIRAKKLNTSFQWFEEMGPAYRKLMNGYDAAYRKFVEAAQKLKNNVDLKGVKASGPYPWNVDFVDVFNYAGLNEYALKVLRAQPYFENEMRVLDSQIVACSDSKLNEQKSMFEALKKEWEKAHASFSQAKEAVLKLPGYAEIQPIVDADEKILLNAFDLLDGALTTIESLNDGDTIGGSLRAWKNVAATAFDTGDSISSGGGPVYTRRLRKSLTELRRIWNDSVVHLDVAYGGSQGWHTMKY